MTVSLDTSNPDLAASRRLFLEGLEALRPRLHRYATRLLSSPLDAEDVIQEALAEAFFKGPILGRQEGLENWLFRVVHNRSMDVLRRRIVRRRPLEPAPTSTQPVDPVVAMQSAEEAFGRLVRALPPKERASLVCKDVLDYSLRETASFLDTTEGAVKAALHRARAKLKSLSDESLGSASPEEAEEVDEAHLRLISLYADRFNARDWDGLLTMLKADANLRVLEVFDGSGRQVFERHYFRNYSLLSVDWSARPAVVAGEPALILERQVEGRARLYSIVRVDFEGELIAGVTDYLHVPVYLLEAIATSLDCEPPAGFEWAHLEGTDRT